MLLFDVPGLYNLSSIGGYAAFRFDGEAAIHEIGPKTQHMVRAFSFDGTRVDESIGVLGLRQRSGARWNISAPYSECSPLRGY